jgi:hypothetical protein
VREKRREPEEQCRRTQRKLYLKSNIVEINVKEICTFGKNAGKETRKN